MTRAVRFTHEQRLAEIHPSLVAIVHHLAKTLAREDDARDQASQIDEAA